MRAYLLKHMPVAGTLVKIFHQKLSVYSSTSFLFIIQYAVCRYFFPDRRMEAKGILPNRADKENSFPEVGRFLYRFLLSPHKTFC